MDKKELNMVKIWIKIEWKKRFEVTLTLCISVTYPIVWLDSNDLRFKGKTIKKEKKKKRKAEAEFVLRSYSVFPIQNPSVIIHYIVEVFCICSQGKKYHFVHSFLWLNLKPKRRLANCIQFVWLLTVSIVPFLPSIFFPFAFDRVYLFRISWLFFDIELASFLYTLYYRKMTLLSNQPYRSQSRFDFRWFQVFIGYLIECFWCSAKSSNNKQSQFQLTWMTDELAADPYWPVNSWAMRTKDKATRTFAFSFVRQFVLLYICTDFVICWSFFVIFWSDRRQRWKTFEFGYTVLFTFVIDGMPFFNITIWILFEFYLKSKEKNRRIVIFIRKWFVNAFFYSFVEGFSSHSTVIEDSWPNVVWLAQLNWYTAVEMAHGSTEHARGGTEFE